MALVGIVGACVGSPIKWRVSGASGCLGVIVKACSDGPASTSSWHGTHCLQSRSSMATPPRAKLSREEPDAGNLQSRIDGKLPFPEFPRVTGAYVLNRCAPYGNPTKGSWSSREFPG